MKKRFMVYSAFKNPVKCKPGPAKVITEEAANYLIELLAADADYYLEELQHELLIEYKIYASLSIISRCIKAQEFSSKRL